MPINSKPIYSSIHALRDAFGDDPSMFPEGYIAEVRTPGSKRKVDKYRLVAMTEMLSSIPSLHWVYEPPQPKASRGGIDWEAYRAGRGR
jgi:hypothetical protein